MNKSNQINRRILKFALLLVFSILFQFNALAQVSNSQKAKLYKLDNYILLNIPNSSLPSLARTLVYEEKSAVYYYDATVKTYGDNPVCLFTDIANYNSINNSEIIKDNIEIITIRVDNISDFNNSINLSLPGSSYPNLKFIYILCTTECAETTIASSLINNNNSIVVLYKIEKGA